MNFNAVCRTCLTTENLNPIFVGSADDKLYAAAVFVTTGINVAVGDGLPQQMCARCISCSNASLKFRKQCKDAQTRLLQVKNECNHAAETLDSGALVNKDFCDTDMLLELIAEEDIEIYGGDVIVRSESDSEVEDNDSGTLHTTELDPCRLDPAGGAAACNVNHKQQLKLKNSYVRLERLPIEDSHHNRHTCETCLVTFDCEPSLRSHTCTELVEKSKFNKVCDEAARVHFKFDICGKENEQRRHIKRHLAAHNTNQGSDKLEPCFSDDATLSATEEFNCDNNYKNPLWNQSALTIHTDEEPRLNNCDESPKEFLQQQHLIRHTREQLKDDIDDMTKKYVCYMCKKHFRNISLLTAHIQVHIKDKLFTCDICKMQFTQNSHLTTHIQIHTGEKPYSCSVCNKNFAHKSCMATHMKIHTGENMYSCNVCKKGFAKKGNLIVHMRIHTGEKPFACDVCKKRFAQSSGLTNHKPIHTGEKPYSCSVCNKQFARKSHLRSHMKGEKLYSCNLCQKQFCQKGSLTEHIRFHTGEKPFACDICKKRFLTSSKLNIHKRLHTGEKPYSCSVCNKKFAYKSHMTTHMKIHTGENLYSCDQCKKDFLYLSNLTEHIKIHTGEKPFACGICKKRFITSRKLSRHKKIHTGEKLYLCSLASSHENSLK